MTRLAIVPGYESLAAILDEALAHAQHGKGAVRHSSGEPFTDQPIVSICEDLGSGQFAIGQAAKKARESLRLGRLAARHELLGAINYLAAAVIVLDRDGMRRPLPDASVDALVEPFRCPVYSNECRIRRECTNKCGRKSLEHGDETPGEADRG